MGSTRETAMVNEIAILRGLEEYLYDRGYYKHMGDFRSAISGQISLSYLGGLAAEISMYKYRRDAFIIAVYDHRIGFGGGRERRTIEVQLSDPNSFDVIYNIVRDANNCVSVVGFDALRRSQCPG